MSLHKSTNSAVNAVSLATNKFFDIFGVRATRPDGFTSNSFHFQSKLTDSNLLKFNVILRQAISSALSTDAEQLLASFAVTEAYREQQIKMFQEMAYVQENTDVANFFKTLATSDKDIAELQSDTSLTIITQPYVNDMTRIYTERREAIRQLKELLVGSAIPQDTAEGWRSAVGKLVKSFPTSKTKDDKTLLATLNEVMTEFGFAGSKIELLPSELVRLREVISCLRDLQQKGTLKSAASRLSCSLENDDDRRIAAQAGDLVREILWPTMVTAMQGTAIAADALESLEMSHAKTIVLSANSDLSFGLLSGAESNAPFSDVISEEALDALAQQERIISGSGGLNETDVAQGKYHDLAKFVHILLHAGVPLEVFARGENLGRRTDRASNAVPASWFSQYVFLKDYLVEFYRGHLPSNVQFTVFDTFLGYVRAAPTKPITIQKMKADLTKAIRDDVVNMVKSVTEASRKLEVVDRNEVLNKVAAKTVVYSDVIMSEHQDRVLRTDTTIDDFLLDPSVVVNSNRTLRLGAEPTSRGKGFSECLLGYDNDQLHVINASSSTRALGELFNKVQDHSLVALQAINVHAKPVNFVAQAYSDMVKGLRRRAASVPGDLTASNLCTAAAYDYPESDFYVQRVEEENSEINVMYGRSKLALKQYRIGNIWGQFSFGIVSPDTSDEKVLDGSFASVGYDVLKGIVNDYFPSQINVVEVREHKISLEEKNDEYVKRISLVDEIFTPVSLPSRSELRKIFAMRAINGNPYDLVTREDLELSERYEVVLRDDASAIIDLIANRHADHLLMRFQPAIVSLFVRTLKEVLTVDEKALLRRIDIIDILNSIGNNIRSVLPESKDDRLLALYYLGELLDSLSIKLRTPAVKALVESGYDPITMFGGSTYVSKD